MSKNETANNSITPSPAAAICQKGEATFEDEDINNEMFYCGYDLDIIPNSENEGHSESSDKDIQIEGLGLQESDKAESLLAKKCNKITLLYTK